MNTETQTETVAENYGRRCADAMNAHDVSLYNVLKQQFNHRKAAASLSAGTGAAADEMQSQFNASYRANLEASHLSQSATDEYWKQKEGKCLACGLEIAVQDQYCPACKSFLIEAHESRGHTA